MRRLKIVGIVILGFLAIVIAIPVGLVAARGPYLAEMSAINFANVGVKNLVAEAARPYSLAANPGITPMQAGELMHSLRAEEHRNGGSFVFRRDVPVVTPAWRETPYDSTLFPGMRHAGWDGPNHQEILRIAAARPTAAQRAYLNAIAADPVWRVFDQIGSAASADVIGGQFEIPFADNAFWYDMPIPRFVATKELAYAGVSRAAAHLAAQRPDSAEHALRSVVAFGFAMSDNAPSLIEQLIGVVVVGIGRDALVEFYTIRRDPRGPILAARIDSLTKQSEARVNLPVPRALNFEYALAPTFAPCTNTKELIFGRSDENQARLDSLRAAVARYPSEEAYFDLLERNAEEGPVGFSENSSPGLLLRLVSGASTMASTVTGNPRLRSCALLTTMSF